MRGSKDYSACAQARACNETPAWSRAPRAPPDLAMAPAQPTDEGTMVCGGKTFNVTMVRSVGGKVSAALSEFNCGATPR